MVVDVDEVDKLDLDVVLPELAAEEVVNFVLITVLDVCFVDDAV